MVDIHMHVIPAVDDGSRSLKESLEMLRLAAGQGITAVIATSHGEAFDRGYDRLVRSRFDELKDAVRAEDIGGGSSLNSAPGGVHEIGSGSDDADYFPPDYALGGAGILHLFADSDFVAVFHKTGQITVYCVIGYAAHGSALRKTAAFSGECQFKLPGNSDSVVKKHFVEITETVKEQTVRILMLGAQIVLHHGRELLHKSGVFRHGRGRRIFGVVV